MGRRLWIFVCVHEGGNICLCICVLVVYVYVSGRALDSASLIILVDPHPPPCPAGGGCRRCVGDFSRRGRMLGRAPAHSRRSIGGAWPYWPCWAPIVGWGAFGSPGPGPGPPWGGRTAGGACGLAATAPWGAYTVAVGGPAFGLSSAFSGWRPRLSLRWFSWGVPCPGGLWMFGARGLFRACFMPCGMGLLFPTHTIKHLHGGTLWTQARSHHKCTLKHSHWYKNRCSQTHIVLICCCFKTYFVILVMCAAQ